MDIPKTTRTYYILRMLNKGFQLLIRFLREVYQYILIYFNTIAIQNCASIIDKKILRSGPINWFISINTNLPTHQHYKRVCRRCNWYLIELQHLFPFLLIRCMHAWIVYKIIDIDFIWSDLTWLSFPLFISLLVELLKVFRTYILISLSW